MSLFIAGFVFLGLVAILALVGACRQNRDWEEQTMKWSNEDGQAATDVLLIVVALVLVVLLLIGGAFGCKSYGRYQKRADANNDVKVTAIQIRNQEQRVKIAKQKAQIRFENAKGIREAQDEIAKTLTPLYVQFEMVEALKAIATSGKNNSLVYIPAGANGIPLVSTNDSTKVTRPEDDK